MKKFLMKGKTIAVIGILSWLMGVIASATDDSGNLVAPVLLIGISGMVDFSFTILAVVRLWKTERVLSVVFILSTVALAILSLIQEITILEYGNPLILITNITKLANFIIFVYVVCLLWVKSKYEEPRKLHT